MPICAVPDPSAKALGLSNPMPFTWEEKVAPAKAPKSKLADAQKKLQSCARALRNRMAKEQSAPRDRETCTYFRTRLTPVL